MFTELTLKTGALVTVGVAFVHIEKLYLFIIIYMLDVDINTSKSHVNIINHITCKLACVTLTTDKLKADFRQKLVKFMQTYWYIVKNYFFLSVKFCKDIKEIILCGLKGVECESNKSHFL